MVLTYQNSTELCEIRWALIIDKSSFKTHNNGSKGIHKDIEIKSQSKLLET
ncbi:hypothetical protein C1H46_000510 [Malus baccata]|uniref:Uncharacterized protein n=1 Tax=Malus baccata TaxID=106549 RepID=A0A540NSA5_MALBA|nr:hypothetical protein C1H46_000510 [Malus baccata]